MKNYTVRLNGCPIKNFTSMEEAQKFMVTVHLDQRMKIEALNYLDQAVLKSDLRESSEVIKYIMEKK